MENENKYDVVGNIIDFEGGDLDDDGIVVLFEHLVDSGQAWSLQGCYGRMAIQLIEAGHINPAS